MATIHMTCHQPPRVPVIARLLISGVCSLEEEGAVLGDLEEEYAERHVDNARQAVLWYWAQVFKSVPVLALYRVRTGWQAIISLFAIASVTSLFVVMWDNWIAIQSAWRIASVLQITEVDSVRNVYAAIYAISLLSIGTTAPILLRMFARPTNTTAFMAYAIIACFALMHVILAIALAVDPSMQQFRLAQFGASCMAFVLGIALSRHYCPARNMP